MKTPSEKFLAANHHHILGDTLSGVENLVASGTIYAFGDLYTLFQENVFKRLIANSKHPNETFCDELYVELYGKTQDELWMDFTIDTGINNGLNGQDHFLIEDNIFTYWLFKLRISSSEPEKLASDTRRGLKRLSKIQNSHMRRLSNKFLNRE